MRGKLLTAAALVASPLLLPAPANATLTLTATDNGASIASCAATSGTGNLVNTCSNAAFVSIDVTAAGVPALTSPDLSTTELAVTTPLLAAAHALLITVDQTGLTFPGGTLTATLTLNSLIETPGSGPFTLTAFAPDGSTLDSMAFTTTGTTSSSATVGAITSDSGEFLLDFAPDLFPQSVDATIEIQGTAVIPEPATMTLLGSALVGFGWLGRRRRNAAPQIQ
ncbi:MAG: PEP-CTERM sorting domain-containing protein [Steroidobacteraceae bacterium]